MKLFPIVAKIFVSAFFVFCLQNVNAQPPNDDVTTAVPLILNIPVHGTTLSATNDYELSGPACFLAGHTPTTAPGRDVVYSFTAPSTGTYVVQVYEYTTGNLVIYASTIVPPPTPPTPVIVAACMWAANRQSSSSFSSEMMDNVNLAAGQQIFIVVDEQTFSGGAGDFSIVVRQPYNSEVEPNNTPATANSLDLLTNTPITGRVSPSTEADFFSLGTVPTGYRIFAMADAASAGPSADVDMRVTTATDVIEYDDLDLDVHFGTSGFAPVLAGVMGTGVPLFLQLDRFGAAPTGNADSYHIFYKIRGPSVTAQVEVEPNDNIPGANSGTGYYSGALQGPAPSTDEDLYTFNATAGDVFFVALDGDPSRNNTPVDAALDILNASGDVLLSVNGSGSSVSLDNANPPGLFETVPTFPAEGLIFRVPSSGTYYVRVKAAVTGATGVGDYLLSISRPGELPPASDDDVTTAVPLTLNIPVQGSNVGATNDYQLASGSPCFSAPSTASTASGGDVVYSFTAPTSGTYVVEVYDWFSGNLVIYSASSLLPGSGLPQDVTCISAANRQSSSGGEALDDLTLAAGENIFIIVDENILTAGTTFSIVVRKPYDSEVEPNNTPATANPLNNFPVTGQVNPATEADFYSLGTFASGFRIFAMADAATAGTSADIDMRITTSTDVIEYDDLDLDVEFGVSGFAPVLAGVMTNGQPLFIQVDRFGAAPVGIAQSYHIFYKVQGPSSTAQVETEPNDDISQANSGSGYYSGSLQGPVPSTDFDIYSFAATAGEVVFVALDGDPLRNNTPVDAALDILNSSGDILMSVNGSGSSVSLDNANPPGLFETVPTFPAEGLIFRVPASGTYYVRVKAAVTGATGVGDYLLSISHPTVPVTSDDDVTTAVPLTLNIPVKGSTVGATNDYQLASGSSCFSSPSTASTAPGGDVVYSFTAPTAGTYVVEVYDWFSGNLVIYSASTLPPGSGSPQDVTCTSAANRQSSSGGEMMNDIVLGAGEQVFIVVDENAFNVGTDFSIVVRRPYTSEVEPNNTPATANPLNLITNAPVTGQVNPATEADFFTLGTPLAGSRIFAMADAGTAGTSADVDMRVTTATDVIEYDDLDLDIHFGVSGFAPVLAGVIATGVPLFLEMDRFGAAPTGISQFYHLFYKIQGPSSTATTEVEPNDGIPEATSGNGYFSGTLQGPAPSTDADLYSFTATAGDVVFVALDGDPLRNNTPVDAALDILNASGDVLLSVNGSGSTVSLDNANPPGLFETVPTFPAEGLIFRVPSSGTYYVRVKAAVTGATGVGDYLLSISGNTVATPSGNVFYSKPSGNLHDLATWGENPDGSGPNPTDFGAGKTFNLANRPGVYTMTGDWTVQGLIVNPGTSQLQINGFTLSEAGMSGTGTITGSPTSSLTITGVSGGDAGTLAFTPGGQSLNNLMLDRTGAASSATLTTPLEIFGSLGSNNGTLNTGGMLTLNSDAVNTARVLPLPSLTSITGDVTVERYIPARRAWRIMCAPVRGSSTIFQAWQENRNNTMADSNPFPGFGTHITGGPVFGSPANGFDQNPGAATSIKFYNSAIDNWSALPSTNGFPVGLNAYMLFIRGDRGIPLSNSSVPPTPTTLRAKGPLWIGDNFNNVNATGFTALANPYASPIDFATITKFNVQNSFYLWDPKMGGANGVGAYVNVSFNGVGWDVTPASVSPESHYIQNGQGFLVRAAIPAPGQLIIKESDKSSTPNTDVFRIARNSSSIRINLQKVNADHTKVLLDEIFTSFTSYFSAKIDDMDVIKAPNVEENLAIVKGDELLMVERRPLLEKEDVIYLRLWNTNPGEYLLQFIPERLSATQSAWLVDAWLKTITPVPLDKSTDIHFRITENASSAMHDRFKLVFSLNKPKFEDVLTKGNIRVYPNPLEGRELAVEFINQQQGSYEVSLVNSLGQVIYRRTIIHDGGSAVQKLKIDQAITDGIYQMHVKNKNEQTTIKLMISK